MKRKTFENKSIAISGVDFISDLLELLRSDNSQFMLQNYDKADPYVLKSRSSIISKERQKIEENSFNSCKLVYP